MDKIVFAERNEINDEKWNTCIDHASNGLIYGYSFYLDHMADSWSALILNDYEAVMPLPWRKKWGVQYIYQPFLTAQLGVFSDGINAPLFASFLKAIPPKFKYLDFSLNQENRFAVPGYPIYERTNFILDLHKDYTQLASCYRQNVKRNIKKAIGYGCSVQKDVDVNEVVKLVNEMQAQQQAAKDLHRFKRLFTFLKQKGNAETYGIKSAKGELLASCVFFFSYQRAYYILVGNHPNGRTLGASHLLIDAFIKDHAGKPITLDFEGSDMRNLAFFYSSFGAVAEKYAAMRLNRLPWFIKWLKK